MIEVRLFATLREGRGKIVKLDFKTNFNGIQLLEDLKIPQEQVSIFLINGHHQSFEKLLSDEDIVSIFPPVGGG
ncbi:MoaD/ThiS family protein [Cetobacterium sp. 8H]|uniref:MoaD/ThiS family protein n=1 Tax=Cetobacterium sp. 8H TaxID=2759681 RepID=UPI00163B98E1|nr:MoaD/ThiS family protein [Cetobacterium sp. 8H]MBC2850389.1 MoaD/ThiS family protein [Cetobacterium sp. 8H]